MKTVRLAFREIKKKKWMSLLLFAVCVIAMQTVLSAVTNAASVTYQKKVFESNINADMERVLHLDYSRTEEDTAFAEVICRYLDFIKELDGVEAAGKFDATGMYFSELYYMEEYKKINGELLKGEKYENYPAITRLLSVDEEILSLVTGGITEYAETGSGALPLYVSETFRDILPVGMTLTDERTGDLYEVAGYIPQNAKWFDENDLIRFPMISLDGWFVAPFTEESGSDILTQLSSLHNTYVLISEDADARYIGEQIHTYSIEHGFEASAVSLSDEYEAYRLEMRTYTDRQILLALFISAMSVSSVVAVFTTNTLLKKKRYGVLIANGFTISDIAAEVTTEIFIIIFLSGVASWIWQWIELLRGEDLFRDVLLTAHISYTLPLCIMITVMLTAAAALIPIINIQKYCPQELIGGTANGND